MPGLRRYQQRGLGLIDRSRRLHRHLGQVLPTSRREYVAVAWALLRTCQRDRSEII
jgi:hypothetical protein